MSVEEMRLLKQQVARGDVTLDEHPLASRVVIPGAVAENPKLVRAGAAPAHWSSLESSTAMSLLRPFEQPGVCVSSREWTEVVKRCTAELGKPWHPVRRDVLGSRGAESCTTAATRQRSGQLPTRMNLVLSRRGFAASAPTVAWRSVNAVPRREHVAEEIAQVYRQSG